MNVLAIEAGGAQFGLSCTSAENSYELAFENRAAFASSEARSLSRDLTIQIDHVLSRANWTTENLDVIAVGVGPGSWTSLRIALASAKTLAQVCGCTLCGVPSFAAWARAASVYTTNTCKDCMVLVTAPCRPDAVYGQIFNIEYSNQKVTVQMVGDEEVVTPHDWAERIAASNNGNSVVYVCGEAYEAVLAELLAAQQNAHVVDVSAQDVANAIAQLGAIKAARGESDDAMTLQPLYIGVSNAERVLNERILAERKI